MTTRLTTPPARLPPPANGAPEPGRRRLLALLAAGGAAWALGQVPLRAAPSAGLAALSLAGVAHVSLRDLARRFGLAVSTREGGAELHYASSTTRLVFRPEEREAKVQGLRVLLGDPVRLHRGSPWLSRIDYDTLIVPILQANALGAPPALRTVCVDPGHGGRDPGTQNHALGLMEKTFVLDVGRRLAERLERDGLRVVLTRTDDTFVPLPERPAMANKARADLFVSVHFNAVAAGRVEGTEHFFLTPTGQRSTSSSAASPSDRTRYPGNAQDGWNTLAAFIVHRQVVRDLGRPDRGLRRARFAVLRDLQCPGVLVEAAYLSHPEEARLIQRADFRARTAEAVAVGVDVYRKSLQRLRAARA